MLAGPSPSSSSSSSSFGTILNSTSRFKDRHTILRFMFIVMLGLKISFKFYILYMNGFFTNLTLRNTCNSSGLQCQVRNRQVHLSTFSPCLCNLALAGGCEENSENLSMIRTEITMNIILGFMDFLEKKERGKETISIIRHVRRSSPTQKTTSVWLRQKQL